MFCQFKKKLYFCSVKPKPTIMKRVIIFSLFLLCGMQALLAQDVIVTRLSERIDAKILEVSETEIKYKKQNNPDGPTFIISTEKVSSVIYSNGEVQSFSQAEPKKTDPTEKSATPTSIRHKGWEFNVSPLLSVNLGNGGGASFQATLGTGRHVADNFFLGFNVGGIFGTVSSFTFGPTARAYFPVVNSSMDFFVELYVGAQTDFDNWGFTPHLIPGMQIPLSRSIDFRFGVGYKGFFIDGASASALALGTSFAFHAPNKQMIPSKTSSTPSLDERASVVEPPKPPKPTLDSGLVLSGGIHAINPLGLTFAVGYKINKKLSLGLGFSMEIGSDNYSEDYVVVNHRASSTSSWSESFQKTHYLYFEDGFRVFARGSYRLTENVVSPLVSVDVGVKEVISHIGNDYLNPSLGGSIWTNGLKESSYAPFIAPSIGLSWKVASNSFLNLRCTYDMALAFVSTDKTYMVYYGYSTIGDVKVHSTYSGTSFISHVFVGLEFNHTLEIERTKKSIKNFFGF